MGPRRKSVAPPEAARNSLKRQNSQKRREERLKLRVGRDLLPMISSAVLNDNFAFQKPGFETGLLISGRKNKNVPPELRAERGEKSSSSGGWV